MKRRQRASNCEEEPQRKKRAPLSVTVTEPDNVSNVCLDVRNKVCRGKIRSIKISLFVLMPCLGYRKQIPLFMDCVKEGNVELVKEHLSRGEQVGINKKLGPSLRTSSQDVSDHFY